MSGNRGSKKPVGRGRGAHGASSSHGHGLGRSASSGRGRGQPVADTIPTSVAEPTVNRVDTRASNKSAHPGNIILENTQKRCTSAQVQANRKQKHLQDLEAKKAHIREYKEKIARVAAFKDQMQQEASEKEASWIRPDLAHPESVLFVESDATYPLTDEVQAHTMNWNIKTVMRTITNLQTLLLLTIPMIHPVFG